MKMLFKPEAVLEKYQDFPAQDLKEKGIKAVFLDIDNTIAAYYQKEADDAAKAFIKELKDLGMIVILISNNNEQRVGTYAKSIDLPYYFHSLKPLPFRYFKVMKEYGLKRYEVVCLGDQLLTDVLAGKLSGIKAYYTKPIINKDSITTVINRRIEKLIFKYILHE